VGKYTWPDRLIVKPRQRHVVDYSRGWRTNRLRCARHRPPVTSTIRVLGATGQKARPSARRWRAIDSCHADVGNRDLRDCPSLLDRPLPGFLSPGCRIPASWMGPTCFSFSVASGMMGGQEGRRLACRSLSCHTAWRRVRRLTGDCGRAFRDLPPSRHA